MMLRHCDDRPHRPPILAGGAQDLTGLSNHDSLGFAACGPPCPAETRYRDFLASLILQLSFVLILHAEAP